MSVTAPTPILLTGLLELAVPLEIAQLRQRGGPNEIDRQEARAFAWTVAEHGDALLYCTTSEDIERIARKMTSQGNHEDAARMVGTSTHEMFVRLARGLAVLAFCPGGARFFDLRWEATT